MKFIKSHRHLIAIAVTVAFISLLHVAAAPLSASPAAVAKARADETDTPRVIEEESDGGSMVRKKSILPIILGVVGVGVIVAAVVLLSKKDNYDIRGTWRLVATTTSVGGGWTDSYTFSGSKSSGTFVDGEGYTGSYTTADKTVNFDYSTLTDVFTGSFVNKDRMSGTLTATSYTGSWVATRTASASSSVRVAQQTTSTAKGQKTAKGDK